MALSLGKTDAKVCLDPSGRKYTTLLTRGKRTGIVTEKNISEDSELQEKVSVRLSRGAYESLSTAATFAEMTVEDFILWAAANQAERVLSGDTILLSEEKWVEFITALDGPAEDLEKLRKIMDRPGFRKIAYDPDL